MKVLRERSERAELRIGLLSKLSEVEPSLSLVEGSAELATSLLLNHLLLII